MAILDGKRVSNDIIDPAKHRYLGSFREPQPPDSGGAHVRVCGCGMHLWDLGSVHAHWLRGHFDSPQYVTVGGDDEA